MILGDYHTHTVYSHGLNSVSENVAFAKKCGLRQIAICDHGFNQIFSGMNLSDLTNVKKDAQLASEEYCIDVLVGVEGNFSSLDGDIGVPKETQRELDVVAVGFHNSIKFGGGANFFRYYLPLLWTSSVEHNAFKSKFTKSVVNAIKRNRIDFISHPNYNVCFDLRSVAQAAYDYGVLFELNGKRINLSQEDVAVILDSGCDFVINSDAHSADKVASFKLATSFADIIKIPHDRIVNWNRLPSFNKR